MVCLRRTEDGPAFAEATARQGERTRLRRGYGAARGWKTEGLSKKFVELIVRPDPRPGNRATAAFTDCAILCGDPNRPNAVVASQLLESKRWMLWVLFEKPIRSASGLPRPVVEPCKSLPEARACE